LGLVNLAVVSAENPAYIVPWFAALTVRRLASFPIQAAACGTVFNNAANVLIVLGFGG